MKELNRYLVSLKACERYSNISTHKEAKEALLSPQGREFLLKSGFPTLSYLRDNKDEFNQFEGVFIDAGVVATDSHEVIVAGETNLTIHAKKPEKLYKIVNLYGGVVNLYASEYAVVTLLEKEATTLIENDGTAIIRIEK